MVYFNVFLAKKVRISILREDLKAFPENRNDFPLHVELSGVSYCDDSYGIIRNISPIWIIEYILEGSGYVQIDGETTKVTKDMIYLLPEGKSHYYYADPEDPFTKIFLNIGGNTINHIVDAYGLTGKYFFDGTGLRETFERIPKIMNSGALDSVIQAAFHGIFVEVISRLSNQEKESLYSKEAIALKAYLDQNSGRIVTSEELSNLIFRSHDYCLKMFKREFGATPYAYQLNNKMRIASYLLSHTNMSVSDISESLGYGDAHYFSNLFKEKFGLRPLKYRKSKREGEI